MVHFTRLFFECSARGKVILRQVVHILCLEHQEFAKKPWFNVNTLFHFELRGTYIAPFFLRYIQKEILHAKTNISLNQH